MASQTSRKTASSYPRLASRKPSASTAHSAVKASLCLASLTVLQRCAQKLQICKYHANQNVCKCCVPVAPPYWFRPPRYM
eukprot:14648-Heterococcus_DN1.PRE.4